MIGDDECLDWCNPAATHLLGGDIGPGVALEAIFPHAAERLLLSGLDGNGPCTLRASPLPDNPLVVDCLASRLEDGRLLLEITPVNWHIERDREHARARQTETSSRLLRHLTHEIKNPLGGLRGAAQLLDRELAQSPELAEYTALIIREADRLGRLIDSLGEPFRRLQPSAVNLHSLIEDVTRLCASEFADVTHRRDYDPSIPELWLDADQWMQLLINLARNACQAGAGQLRWQTRIEHRVMIDGDIVGRAVAIRLFDNGHGFPADMADRLFEPLFSLSEDGRGLGLSISQSIVAAHKGSITAESTDQGACFRILVPLVTPK